MLSHLHSSNNHQVCIIRFTLESPPKVCRDTELRRLAFSCCRTGVSSEFDLYVIVAGQSSSYGDTHSHPASSNVIHYATCSSPKVYNFSLSLILAVYIIAVVAQSVKIFSGDSECTPAVTKLQSHQNNRPSALENGHIESIIYRLCIPPSCLRLGSTQQRCFGERNSLLPLRHYWKRKEPE